MSMVANMDKTKGKKGKGDELPGVKASVKVIGIERNGRQILSFALPRHRPLAVRLSGASPVAVACLFLFW